MKSNVIRPRSNAWLRRRTVFINPSFWPGEASECLEIGDGLSGGNEVCITKLDGEANKSARRSRGSLRVMSTWDRDDVMRLQQQSQGEHLLDHPN